MRREVANAHAVREFVQHGVQFKPLVEQVDELCAARIGRRIEIDFVDAPDGMGGLAAVDAEGDPALGILAFD